MKNLLIIGAGGHGKVIKEIAEDIGAYEKIEFVDDNSSEAIGKFSDLKKLNEEFDSAFVSIGNIELRKKLIDFLKTIGYEIPVLIHPSAYVSKSCKIEFGTVIEPMAIVNSNSIIGEASIISVGSIVDHNAQVGCYCQIDAGAVVESGSIVARETKVIAGQLAE